MERYKDIIGGSFWILVAAIMYKASFSIRILGINQFCGVGIYAAPGRYRYDYFWRHGYLAGNCEAANVSGNWVRKNGRDIVS